MTDYKLVPTGPTPEWVANLKRVRIGLMESVIEDVLAAAPAVQAEPVEFCEDRALSLAERTFSFEIDEHLAEDVIQYARRLHDLYAAPQPAPALSKFLEKEEWNDAFAQGFNAGFNSDEKTAPDVEALENIRDYWNRDPNEYAMSDALWHIIAVADAALATHHKNGGEK